MVYHILNPKCPTQQVLDRIASKWTMLVILALERDMGRGLANTVAVIRAWAYDNIDGIARARSRFDREASAH